MYNRLHNRKSNVFLNILLCLPVLILWAGYFLFEEKILISSIPFRKYLLYIIVALIIASLFYKLLIPWHEIGHYLLAVFLKKRHQLEISIWMDRSHTFCSNWKVYKSRDARIILCAGMLFKIIYCTIMIVIFWKMNIKFGIMIFSYVIWIEIVLNGIPILEESDGYKTIHVDAFYNEESEKIKEGEDLFIKWVYPLFLAGITVVVIVLLRSIEKILISHIGVL